MSGAAASSWDYPGARWWKFDFHAHTPASYDYRDPEATPEDWLLGFMRAEIDCVAVTDHNSGAWVDRLKLARNDLEGQKHPDFRPLYLFPGVEITANGNIHVLAILDPDKMTSDVDRLLGAVKYQGQPGESQQAVEASVIEVVSEIVKAGGIAIPAHVDRSKGLWSLSGNSLRPVLDSGDVFAIEVVDTSAAKPELYAQCHLDWAEVLGSDSHRPRGADSQRCPGTHYTWIKMEWPSIDGLRLALLDGEKFSVHRSDDQEMSLPLRLPKHHVCSIEIDQARYMGLDNSAKLEFSPWLNVLIGGRGTGKSTILHCLRLAARRESELQSLGEHSNSRTNFERFSQVPKSRNGDGGLKKETHITWTLDRHGVPYRVHWKKQLEDGLAIVEERSDAEKWIVSQAQHVSEDRFPIRLFSQGQIAELAGDNQSALLNLIDEGAGSLECKQAIEAMQRAYMETRSRIRNVDTQLADRDRVTVALADIEREIAAVENSGHAEILESFRRGERQKRELDHHFNIADQAAFRIAEFAEQLQPEDTASGIFDENDNVAEDARNTINMLRLAIENTSVQLREIEKQLKVTIDRQRSTISISQWQRNLENIQAEYSVLTETMEKSDIGNPERHAILIQERQRLIDLQLELESLQEEKHRLESQAQEEQVKLVQARRSLSEARVAFLANTLDQNEFIRIRLIPYGDDPLVIGQSLREILNVEDDRFTADIGDLENSNQNMGIVNRLLDDLPEALDDRREMLEERLEYLQSQFVKASEGRGEFGGQFNNYLQRQRELSEQFIDRLLTWFPQDSLHVEHRVTGKGTEFKPIRQGSAGQRSAAILAFLLAHGEEPLVLDQPEDDLDNQLIYSLVVRQTRENKLRRQIIAITHNPNIVVNGDAEMVHVLDFRKGQCRVVQSGSLQIPEIRDQVCQVMEGGRDAFERRYQRLEAGLGDV